MQSISAVEVFISNTTKKLFFSPKAPFIERYKLRTIQRKNFIIPTLCALVSLPVQAAMEDAAESAASTASSSSAPVTPGNTINPASVTTSVEHTTTDPASKVAPAPSNTATPTVGTTAPVADVAVTRPATEIGSLIASKQHPYMTRPDFTHRVADLDALYQASAYQPIWLSDDSSKNAAEVIKVLESASVHGLNAADYDTSMLRQKLNALKPPLDMKSKDLALYDTAVSLALLRFSYDLHYGRINPRDLSYNIQQRTEKSLDIPDLIKNNLAQDSLAQIPVLVEPKLPQYQKLKQVLANYRTGESVPAFKMDAKSTIRPGNPLPQSAELQKFLSASGDLPADKVDNTVTTYTDILVEAVKKYQQRHNIKANGTINKATIAAFGTVSSSLQKEIQIELAMERLRWLPEITQGRAVMVNIPAFQLFAYDDINQDSPTTTMRVVVGKAAKNQTPLLTADMRFVDFHPYWNVPFKIARDEILPKLAENPDYLAGQNMELVSRSGKSIGSYGSYDGIRMGSLGIRQRPGKGNALGKVKFIFPNKSDVYLHDTPSVSLFGRSRRDLSHGCVRVARPEELAKFVLKEDNWDEEAIKKAIKSSRNQRIILKNTIPVLFLYNTAFFDENNNLTFYTDIYQQDAKLIEALKSARKDLSDKELFAPKELPPAEDSAQDKIEAKHEPVSPPSAKQTTSANESVATVNTKQISPPVTGTAKSAPEMETSP